MDAERLACVGTGGGAREDAPAELRRSIGRLLRSASSRALFSSRVGRRPRQRRDFGGSGFIFGLVDFVGLAESTSARLGVMMPGFSCWAATSWTLREDDDAGSRCMPNRSACVGFGCMLSIDGTGSSTRVGDNGSGELVSVMVLDISSGDSVLSAMGTPSVVDWERRGIGSDSVSVGRSQSTVAHRTTSLLVVSSTSSKCRILS